MDVRQGQAQPVPNSVGTEPPKLKAPAKACDCYMHIYDPARFAMPPSKRVAPSNATVADYRLLQKRIGTTRCCSTC
jgi:predicted TIM-barrel fold metal-dependent hydrolase